MTRPTKITPDPIIEAVVELRFESDVPADAIFGMVFAHIKPKYPDFKKLDITSLPEPIRKSDPSLKYNPYYQAESGPFKLNIGPQVISLTNTGQYTGWKKNFFPELKGLLENLAKSGVVKHFSRLGVRYIDFFEPNIYKNINLDIYLNGNPLDALQSTFSAVFKTNEFLTRIQVVEGASVNIQDKSCIGAIVDTDTYIDFKDGFTFDGLNELIDKCHEESVSFFFNLLKPEFIETLNPEYP